MATIPSRHGAHAGRRATAWVLALAAVALSGTVLLAQAPQPLGVSQTGLPLPRFVSLKADRVQVRQGPGTDHKILWVFNRVGLPVEVIQEHENWRQIRDQDGAVGWVANNLLSARRTGVVLAWATGEARTGTAKPVPLYSSRASSAASADAMGAGARSRSATSAATSSRASSGASTRARPSSSATAATPFRRGGSGSKLSPTRSHHQSTGRTT